ncbi:MAG TPA: putative Ig domain-containing protein [Steroidobacteraceae bacterium]|nr:putative Ig domain-containing protein [Steroidobacteraceae bacterium]HRX88853.1 putative Ig domain-containing protein [Steroidobacteraceae bacterium]
MRVLFYVGALIALAACGGGESVPTVPPLPAPSALSYASPQLYTVGVLITPSRPSVTGTVTSYGVAPALPAGLSLNTTTGEITGTPTTAVASATYTITAQNSTGSTSFALSITVNPATQVALEPTGATTLGVGQLMNVYFVQRVGGAVFPAYVDPTLVTWSSDNPSIVAIDARGVLAGMREGSATITAQYQAFTSQLNVLVAGAFLANTVNVPGQGIRRYAVYVPSTGTMNTRSLLVSMHGGGGTGQLQAAMTQLVRLAQQQQFLIAFPEGTGLIQTFNAGACCGSAQTQDIDDFSFVRAVIDDMQTRYAVDSGRVFATGFSNGGMMAHRLACQLADRIAGIAAVGGASGQFDRGGTQYYPCNPTRPIPVLHIHGTNDRNYPFAGGTGNGISATDFYPVEATIDDWLVRNNLNNQATTEQVSATTSCRQYATPADPSRASAKVTLCSVDPPDVYDAANEVVYGGGHSWPGGLRSPSAKSDSPVTDFNASDCLWNFFVR